MEQATINTTQKKLNYFERYLSVWVGACMIVGVSLGKLIPRLTDTLRHLEFGKGSQSNVPIGVLVWLR
jgi:ACR3 family arsenite transporter